MVSDQLARATAVVGVGTSAYGRFPERDGMDLAADAFDNALADAGLDRSVIDGLVVHRLPYYQRVSEMLGLQTRYTSHPGLWGGMSGVEVVRAVPALVTGTVNYVAFIYADDSASRSFVYGGKALSKTIQDPFEPWGYTAPAARAALQYQRYAHLYGVSSEGLAEVPLAMRHNAQLNPQAVMYGRTMTLDDYVQAPWIVEPLRRNDCCLVNDGAVCIIMTTSDRARDCRQDPVYLAGLAERDEYANHDATWSTNFGFDALRSASRAAHGMAGLQCSDVDVVCAYDHFSPGVLFQLEGLGFCDQGEGADFIAGGRIRVGGALPVNPHGGHLSESYMLGWTQHVEAVRQVRQECGDRQVPGARVAQYVNPGAPITTILYTAD